MGGYLGGGAAMAHEWRGGTETGAVGGLAERRWWCGGTMVRWCGGTVVRWCGGALRRGRRDGDGGMERSG